MFFDEKLWKQLGYMVVGIWGLFSPALAIFLGELNFHWAIVLFLTGSWVFIDAFMLAIIIHYFNIELPEKESKSKIVQPEKVMTPSGVAVPAEVIK